MDVPLGDDATELENVMHFHWTTVLLFVTPTSLIPLIRELQVELPRRLFRPQKEEVAARIEEAEENETT